MIFFLIKLAVIYGYGSPTLAESELFRGLVAAKIAGPHPQHF